jgi:hypothetical protein
LDSLSTTIEKTNEVNFERKNMARHRNVDGKDHLIREKLLEGVSQTKIAVEMKVGITRIQRIKNELENNVEERQKDEGFNLARQVTRLREENKILQSKFDSALRTIDDYEFSNKLYCALEEFKSSYKPDDYKIKQKGKKTEATFFALASDWHLGEKVEKKQVNGLNEFNRDIATRRARTFFNSLMNYIEMYRTRSVIRKCVFSILGDMISGFIHEDLRETNEMSVPDTCILLHELLVPGLELLEKEGKFDELYVVFSTGNHGRLTHRPRIKNRNDTNLEYLTYLYLALWFRMKGSKIKFMIPDGYFTYLSVYDKITRHHHGDYIRYQGGIGGVHIPLNKALAQWDRGRRADIDVMGHWHTNFGSSRYHLNGSLIGYNEFAMSIKAIYEPPSQSCFLVHSTWGKTSEGPIFLDKK